MRRWRGATLAALLLVAGPALAQGLLKEPDAVYRSFPVTSRYRAFLPPDVDLSLAFPQPGQQGQQPSCVAWAVGYALRSYYEHWRKGWDVRDVHHLVSPTFIYDAVTAQTASCGAGTTIPDALNLLQTVGAVSLADVPYNPRQCTIPNAQALLGDAQDFRIDGWQRVDLSSLDNVKGELHNGNPVVFGMFLSDSFMAIRGDRIYDDVNAPRTEGHAMVLVGYSEKRQAFKLMNSWGPDWGDHGFGWISYRAFGAFVDRAYVARVSGTPPLETFMASLQNPPAKPPATTAPTPPPAPAPAAHVATTTPPPAPARESLADLSVSLKQFDCADVALSESGGKRRVAGYVANADDRAKIESEIARVDPSQRPDAQIDVRPWPQCEALGSFAEPLADPHGLAVAINGGAPSELRGGDSIAIEVTTPDFPSYLYVTYVEASGDAIHLYQPPGVLSRALAPGSRITIGGPGQEMRVGAPFGPEMLVAIASGSPLFTGTRPDEETERDFLTAFRAAYIAKSAGGLSGRLVAASVLTLDTVAPKP